MTKVFISYSWESDEHSKWVREFADRLITTEGIDAYIDQYDILPGDRLPQSMEKLLKQSEYVLVICTPEYKYKADNRIKGVGYEGNMIAQEIYEGYEGKYIPILRKGTFENSLPRYLNGTSGIDLSGDPYSDSEYRKLINLVKNISIKPPLKKNRYKKDADLTKNVLEYLPYYEGKINNVEVIEKSNKSTVYLRSKDVVSGSVLKNVKLINKVDGNYILVDLFDNERCDFIIDAACAFGLISGKKSELVINGSIIPKGKNLSEAIGDIKVIELYE